jgi:hypothetical protein
VKVLETHPFYPSGSPAFVRKEWAYSTSLRPELHGFGDTFDMFWNNKYPSSRGACSSRLGEYNGLCNVEGAREPIFVSHAPSGLAELAAKARSHRCKP